MTTFELKSDISKIINYDCFEDLVKISKENNVKKFIYASTYSVYGVSSSGCYRRTPFGTHDRL